MMLSIQTVDGVDICNVAYSGAKGLYVLLLLCRRPDSFFLGGAKSSVRYSRTCNSPQFAHKEVHPHAPHSPPVGLLSMDFNLLSSRQRARLRGVVL